MFHVERGTGRARSARRRRGSTWNVDARWSGGVASHHPRPRDLRPRARRSPRGPRSAGRATARWRRPSSVSAAAGQRVGSCVGGSLTTSRPPTRRRALATSAVTSGGAKLRATTASWLPRQSSSWASTSARPVTTWTRSPHPNRPTTRRSQSVRLTLASSRVTIASGRSAAITSPGTPPPEPRSSTRVASAIGSTKPRACSASASRSCPPPRSRELAPRPARRGPPASPAAGPVRGGTRPTRASVVRRSPPAPVGPAGASITLCRTAVVSRPRPPGR